MLELLMMSGGEVPFNGRLVETILPTDQLTEPSRYAASLIYNDEFYVLGGQTAAGNSRSFWKFNLTTQIWTKLPDAPTTLRTPNIFYNKADKLYCYTLTNLYTFNVTTNSWETTRTSSQSVGASWFFWNGDLYTGTGTLTGPLAYTFRKALNSSDQFVDEAFLSLGVAITTANCIVVGDYLYSFGGVVDGVLSERCFRWNLNTKVREELTPIANPSRTNLLYPMYLNGRIYLIGGAGSGSVAFSTVTSYDPELGTFAYQEPGLTESRRFYAYTSTEDAMYICGGTITGTAILNKFQKFTLA